MTRKLTNSERAELPDLPIVVPEYVGSHPFSRGTNPELYLEEELKKEADEKSLRTDWFEKNLFAIWRELGGEVPYAFCVNGAVRSLDAGCLGYLVNRSTPELALSKDSEGYIIAVTPIGLLASRYSAIERRLRREIRPPASSTLDDLPGARPEASNDVPPPAVGREADVAGDIVDLTKDGRLEETERKQLIEARIGQGTFRARVLERWNNCCAITGCELRPVLRASHIKPWRSSTNKERLDPENGLPLTANIDAMFDRGLISFDNDGRVLFSPSLEAKHRALVPEPRRLSRVLTATARDYLAEHRKANGFG